MHSNKGYVLLTVLSLLFVLGFLALDNARYLANALSGQSYMYQRRASLDWELESMLNCQAMHLSVIQNLPNNECDNDAEVQVVIEPQQAANQYKIEAHKESIATSAVIQFGDMDQDYAVISNFALDSAFTATSSLVEPSALLSFYAYNDIALLQPRWGSTLEVTSKQTCGSELLTYLTQTASTDIVIEGSCAINLMQWQQVVARSQQAPLNLLFVGDSIELMVSGTLRGILAIWQQTESTQTVVMQGTLSIDGGLQLHLAEPMDTSQAELLVLENTYSLQEARVKFAKRSWLQGSWRDF
ncbi:hypothetical protein [Vibrio sp. B1Z05]|uniref:hypothetical protein n=1 Tax=Vibrio sp. B1Z05 TaxID=2654980 RepID=UPI001561D52E|nr:hypothetical protein [Vibrio sp. B1Z05]